MTKILLVEDDAMIASGLKYALEMEKYEVVHVTNVKDAFDTVDYNNFNLAILDMQLPDGIGFDVSDRLKMTDTAVIFLTVVDDENNIVKAFEDGAADYVVKPFRVRELLARVKRTLASQGSNTETANLIKIGSAQINTDSGKVFVNGENVELTALEYRLLLIYANHKGILLSRAQILEKIWDVPF